MTTNALATHQQQLRNCRQCPEMIPPVITGQPVASKILLIGQAPGIHEGEVRKPFGWTAGKTLFQWFERIGLTETQFRECVYMAAVCRCFPGKAAKAGKGGGDRVPSKQEIAQCRPWLEAEINLLKPELIIPVGKLAIAQSLDFKKLTEVIGQTHHSSFHGHECDLIPLPHPSGASTWHRMQPGKDLLNDALKQIEAHSAWHRIQQRR